MKSQYIIFCISLCCITACSKKSDGPTSPSVPPKDTIQYVIKPQHDIIWPTLASTPWPKARHDAQCTGRSSYNGPQLGRVKSSIHLNSWGGEDPAVGPDSVFYVVSDSSLFAVTFDGTILWKSPLEGYWNINAPLIGSNGIIYVGSLKMISAFRYDGSLLWQTTLDGKVYLKSCGIGLDGTIYLCTSNSSLYAIDQSGNIVWQRQAPGGSILWGDVATFSFSPDGNRFYLGGNTAQQSLYVLNTSGVVLRTDSLGGRQYGAISIDNEGNLFSFFGGDLVSISDSGNVRWRIRGTGENWDVTIDPNGNVAYLSAGNLVSVDNDGQERWKVSLQPLDYSTHLVCDAEGTIYTETSADFKNYDVQAINDKGKILWTVSVPAYVKYGGTSLTREGYLLLPLYGPGIPEPPQLYIIE